MGAAMAVAALATSGCELPLAGEEEIPADKGDASGSSTEAPGSSDAGSAGADSAIQSADAQTKEASSSDGTAGGGDAQDGAPGDGIADTFLSPGSGDGHNEDSSSDSSAGSSPSAADGASDSATKCGNTLSNVGNGDFDISFTFTTTQSGLVALLNQRKSCAPSTYWDIRVYGGVVRVEIDDVPNYTQVTSAVGGFDDGQPHDVAVQRRSGTLTLYVDSVVSGSSASTEVLHGLGPVNSGVDVCQGQDGTMALVGTLTNVCLSEP
jgi:hypothetical protein